VKKIGTDMQATWHTEPNDKDKQSQQKSHGVS